MDGKNVVTYGIGDNGKHMKCQKRRIFFKKNIEGQSRYVYSVSVCANVKCIMSQHILKMEDDQDFTSYLFLLV